MFFKSMFAVVALLIGMSLVVMAQGEVAPQPVSSTSAVAVAPAPAQSSSIMGWIEAHGGFQASVLLVVFVVFTGLSALRTILYKLDGIEPGQPIPADKTTLTTVNKICLFLGAVIDFIQGNTKH